MKKNTPSMFKSLARPSHASPAFLFEDGIFETLRSEKREIVALEEHLNRLFESANTLGFSLGVSRQALRRLLRGAVSAEPYPRATLRIAFLRDGRRARLFLVVKEARRIPRLFYEKGIAVRTSPTRRHLPLAQDPQLKVRDYLNGLLSTLDEPVIGKSLEEIYLNAQGCVTEGRISNLFMAKAKRLYTPPPSAGILRGVTRDQVIAKARRMEIPVHEEPFTRFGLYTAEEVFLTNTSMGAVPVVSVDGRVIGSGKVGPVSKRMIRFLKGASHA